MDILSTLRMKSAEIIEVSCKVHTSHPLDLINLKQNTQQRRLCFRCVQELDIPLKQVISLREILEADEDTIFHLFPPIKDQKLFSSLDKLNQDFVALSTKVDGFYDNLSNKINESLQISRQAAKQKISQLTQLRSKCLDEYKEIAKINDFQQTLLQTKEGRANEEDLETLFQEIMKSTNEKINDLSENIKQWDGISSSLQIQKTNQFVNQICKQIKSIDLFQYKITVQIIDQESFQKSNDIYEVNQNITLKQLIESLGKRPYGRTIYVNGVEASPQDILSSFEKKKGRQKEKLLIEFSDMTVC